jgi:hypothetical protein
MERISLAIRHIIMIYVLTVKSVKTIQEQPLVLPDEIKAVKLFITAKDTKEVFNKADAILAEYLLPGMEKYIGKDSKDKNKLSQVNAIYNILEIHA